MTTHCIVLWTACKRLLLWVEWKAEGVIDGESEGGDCDEVTCADEVNQQDSEQKEVDGMKKGVDSTGLVMCKSGWWFVVRKINEKIHSSVYSDDMLSWLGCHTRLTPENLQDFIPRESYRWPRLHLWLQPIWPPTVSDKGRRQLRSVSSATSRTCVVRRNYSNYGDRCFAAAGPKLWNSLRTALYLRQAETI